MKKSIGIAVVVALVIAVFAVVAPVIAKGQPGGVRTVYEADIVPSFAPMATHDLDKGQVYVREDGSVKLEIEGASPDTTYHIWFGTASGSPWTLQWTLLGTLITDGEGDGEFTTTITVDGTRHSPVFGINYPQMYNQFVTGF